MVVQFISDVPDIRRAGCPAGLSGRISGPAPARPISGIRPDNRPDIKIPAAVNFLKLSIFPHTSNE